MREQRKYLLVGKHAAEMNVVQTAHSGLPLQSLPFRTLAKQQKLNFFMAGMLCHIQQRTKPLCQTDITNVNAGKRMIQMMFLNPVMVNGTVQNPLVKAVAHQLYLV